MKTKTETLENTSVRLGLAIQRLRARMRAESQNSGGWGLSQLLILKRIIERGPVTANEIARSEHLRPQSVAETVTALKADGLIRTAPDPNDDRKVLLTATKAGHAVIDEVVTARAAWLHRAVEQVVSPDELDDLVRAIDLLNRLADCDTGSAERDRK